MPNEPQFELVIEADTNDADYVTRTTTVIQAEIDELKPIFDIIKSKHGKWETGDIGDSSEEYKDLLTPQQIDWICDLVPHGEYGIHTIESVVYYPLPVKTTLL